MSTVPQLERRKIPVDQISPAAYNPRLKLVPGSPKWEELKTSLLEFGEAGGIVWNEQTTNLVGGHQRFWMLVEEFDATEIEVVVVNLDEQRERVLNLRLNKPASDWDAELLPEAYARIDEELRWLTGFQDAEINDIVRQAEVEMPASFLDDLARGAIEMPGVGGSEIKDDHPHRTGEQYFNVQLVFDSDQRQIFMDAVTQAKQRNELTSTMDAVVAIADFYLGGGSA